MSFKIALLIVAYFGGLAAREIPIKRQVDHTTLSKQDHVPAETGFLANPAAAVHAGSKFFQDIYVAMDKPDELEFGHVRETPNDWEQRYEKLNLENLNRQGKVRWGDKHGGYGEHYWDYNHAGHNHDGEGDESRQNSEYAEYEETKHVPVISSPQQQTSRDKREPTPSNDVEFINDKARSLILDGNVKKHGGNYKAVNDNRGKREQNRVNKRTPTNFGQALVFNADEGVVIDEQTGLRYQLSPF
ncbi:uncharacterized protein LOC130892306 isoform X1 [Diorhabda carinulata]|uniref:uncharacterized protein LOC130892306 isoform X1 n=1 Tax=Diorhabda carinulata TaxID=1163345 RepID=UPI0025A013F9|nr:uncharacterized protein LOC130892306 isoform X1 [Diorhabda carinulata]